MFIAYRVLLPNWVFDGENDEEIDANIKHYLERYPSYSYVKNDGKFAICRYIKSDKER